jgi:hypothetical protein
VVTDKTKMIANGVEARVIRDTASEKGVPVEVTDDWFAQDNAGNIWYLGEYVTNYENGKVVDHEGSFEAGVDGPPGPQGLKGDTGAPGTNGATNLTTVTASCSPAPCTGATANCPTGQKATGGGGIAGGNQFIFGSSPSPGTGTPSGWSVLAASPSGSPATSTVTAYVVCASP